MTQKFGDIKREMTVQEALDHVRKLHAQVETLTDLYVLDDAAKLLGVLSLAT
jgi:magnesium transporter